MHYFVFLTGQSVLERLEVFLHSQFFTCSVKWDWCASVDLDLGDGRINTQAFLLASQPHPGPQQTAPEFSCVPIPRNVPLSRSHAGLLHDVKCSCDCRITNEGLPTSLGRLPHLKAIGLKKNRLTSVPRLLGSLRSLQEIYLEDNDELEVMLSPHLV